VIFSVATRAMRRSSERRPRFAANSPTKRPALLNVLNRGQPDIARLAPKSRRIRMRESVRRGSHFLCRRRIMNIALQVERSPEEAVAATSAVEGELREFVRRDLTTSRKFRLETFADSAAGEVSTLISRMAGASVAEIDKLLDELQSVRDYLQAEGERVEREAARYAEVSQTALASVRIITDSMGQWKGATGERRDSA
jgi:hypothetical protein